MAQFNWPTFTIINHFFVRLKCNKMQKVYNYLYCWVLERCPVLNRSKLFNISIWHNFFRRFNAQLRKSVLGLIRKLQGNKSTVTAKNLKNVWIQIFQYSFLTVQWNHFDSVFIANQHRYHNTLFTECSLIRNGFKSKV